MSSSKNIPEPILYGNVLSETNSGLNAPRSPSFCPSSPIYNPDETCNIVSPPYSMSSPDYNAHSPHIPRSPSISSESRIVTITDSVHIPTWATGFVLGGQENKHLYNIFRKHGSIVDIVGVQKYESRDCRPINIVCLIAIGRKEEVSSSMRAVKHDLLGTIKKAKQMKHEGTWRDERRHHHREDRRHHRREDRRHHHREDRRHHHREDRRHHHREDRRHHHREDSYRYIDERR